MTPDLTAAACRPPPYVLACPPGKADMARTAVDTAGLDMMVEVMPSPFLEGEDAVLFRRDGQPVTGPKALGIG